MSFYKALRSFAAGMYQRSPFFSPAHYRRGMLALLRTELRRKKDFRILEVGAREGQSVLIWAKACENAGNGAVTCVDWWIEEPVERAFKANIARSGLAHRVTAFKGNSNDVLPTLSGKTYDFIFIDGGHSYSQTKSDLLNTIPLLADGGVLCGDDLELTAGEVDAGAMSAYREEDVITDPRTGRAYHPGVAAAVFEILGTAIARDRVFWATRKTGGKFEPAPFE